MNSDQSEARVSRLKFAEEHVEPILKGQKEATIRVADRDELPSIGDRVHLCDGDGECFATAIVDDRGWTTVDMAARMDIDGHRSYRDAEELLDELERYYPDEGLGEQSQVELVYWGDLWE